MEFDLTPPHLVTEDWYARGLKVLDDYGKGRHRRITAQKLREGQNAFCKMLDEGGMRYRSIIEDSMTAFCRAWSGNKNVGKWFLRFHERADRAIQIRPLFTRPIAEIWSHPDRPAPRMVIDAFDVNSPPSPLLAEWYETGLKLLDEHGRTGRDPTADEFLKAYAVFYNLCNHLSIPREPNWRGCLKAAEASLRGFCRVWVGHESVKGWYFKIHFDADRYAVFTRSATDMWLEAEREKEAGLVIKRALWRAVQKRRQIEILHELYKPGGLGALRSEKRFDDLILDL